MKSIIFKTLSLILALALSAGVLGVLCPSARALDDPAIATEAALLVDMDTGAVLYAKNEHERRAPASMVKIMTVLLAIEAYERGDVSLTDKITVSASAFTDVGSDGTTIGIREGEQISYEDLIYCAILASANESCNVLAEAVSGDIPTFVALMNARAAELGCEDTSFANTHGMPSNFNYTTAHDLYIITAAAMKHNLFKRVVSAASHTVPATNMSDARELNTTNNLINERNRYYYKYATGVKTGYTDAAGYCLIATAEKEGRSLMSIVLGGVSFVADDGRTMIQSFTETTRLLDWGFDNFSYQQILSTMDLIKELPVDLGLGVSSVVARPESSISALLPNDVDISERELDVTIFDEDESLVAPIEQGRVLGQVTVSLNGQSYGTVNLVANTKVELDRAAYVGSEISATLANKYVRLAITVIVVLIILYIAFIIYYNYRRRSKRKVADALARERIREYRRSQETTATTGKTFEEIEALRRAQPRDIPSEPIRPERIQRPIKPASPAEEETTTGKSFEEIEAFFRKQDEQRSRQNSGGSRRQ